MATRHEEKYIIDYRQYLMIREKLRGVLTPDRNSPDGTYVINSLYYDDHRNSALLEKLDGLPEHSKFRVRSYGFSKSVIKLERKDKHGVLTEKCAVNIAEEQIPLLGRSVISEDPALFALTAQMQAGGLIPAIVVRYTRDAFFHEGTDLRITFDRNIESVRPDVQALFNPRIAGIPVFDGNTVIMEIKYGKFIPGFARKLTNVGGKQLSVSKYALCRESYII